MADRSSYLTKLSPKEEKEFQRWFLEIKSKLGRDLDMNDPGYDMRGFWKAGKLSGKGPAYDPSSGEVHFTDTYKTPRHPTQSAESIYAPPGAPTWNEHDQLVDESGIPTLGYLSELILKSQLRQR